MDRPRAIVKVGKSSGLKLSGVKTFRAVTFEEVDRLLSKQPTVSAVIIESILPYEVGQAEGLVDSLRSQGKFVFIHCINGANSQESRVSEEKGVDISTSLEGLQHSISKALAVRAYTAWGRKIPEISTSNEQTEATEQQEEPVIERSRTVYRTSELQEAIEELSADKPSTEHTNIGTKEEFMSMLSGVDGIPNLSLDLSFDDDSAESTVTSKEVAFEGQQDQTVAEMQRLLEEVTKEKQKLSEQLGEAFDKVQTLLSIKEAVEDERDMYKKMLSSIETSTEIIEDPVPGAKLEEAKRQLMSLQSANISLEQSVIEYKAEVTAEKSRVKSITDELATSKQEVARLTGLIEASEVKIAQLAESASANEAVKVELTNAQVERANLERQVTTLKSKIKDLTAQVDSARSSSSADDLEKIQELRVEIDELSESLNSANENTTLEARSRRFISMMLSEAVKQKGEANEALLQRTNEVAELRALEKKLRGSIRSSEEQIQLLQQKYNSLVESSSHSSDKLNSEMVELEARLTSEINELRVELGNRTQEVRRTKKELDNTKANLSQKEAELANLMLTSGASKKDVKKAIEAQKKLEHANETLQATVDTLRKEVRSLTAKISMTEDANERLEETNKQLRNNIATFKATARATPAQSNINTGPKQHSQPVVAGFGKITLNCNYSGRGYIIPVFGSGSYGITTMAMSIARKLQKASVLYLDFDITSPKADAWFGKVPIIRELTDIGEQLNRSGFGALLEKGSAYVIDHKDQIVQRIYETRNGACLDYFSGVYNRVDPRKLMVVDFSDFLTYFGNKYNYIIVDLGRYGSSDIVDELIKMFNRIAYKSVIVTLNDKFDTRNMSVRITTDKIRLDNSIWVLNMSVTSRVDAMVQKAMGAAKPVVIPKDMNMYGNNVPMDKVPILKDRLTQVMDMITE